MRRRGGSFYTFVPGANVLKSLAAFEKNAEVVGIEQLEFYKPASEQIELLRSLYQAQDDSGRKEFIETCSQIVSTPRFAATVFVFLIRYYSFQHGLELLTGAATPYFIPIAQRILPALSQVLSFDHSFIENEELESLCLELKETVSSRRPKGSVRKNAVGQVAHQYNVLEASIMKSLDSIDHLVSRVCSQANRIRYIRLRKELRESVNFEINQDLDRLTDNLALLGFTSQLTAFLRFAELEFGKANDSFDYKTCVDQIRSFFAELLSETAEKIATKRGTTLATAQVDTKRPVEIRKYLESAGFFSEEFRKLVEGHYQFMSEAGTHTLGATKDVARIARNIAIEIGLLVTKRLQQP